MAYIYIINIFFLLLIVFRMKAEENIGLFEDGSISLIDQYVVDFVIKLRADKKLSQTAIGNILEVSRSYIADIENPNRIGKYNLTHINILAEHFQISPKDFLPEKAFKTKAKFKK